MIVSQESMILMEKFALCNPPVGEQVTPKSLREFSHKLQDLRGPIEAVENIIDDIIHTKSHDIPVRIYRPTSSFDLPIIMYFHGGGHVIGDLVVYDNFCRALANRANCLVVSVDYRRAPEHQYPSDQEDAYIATRWVAEHGQEFKGDTNKIFVVGDSSGANLAIQVTLNARDNRGPHICGQILIYPETDEIQ